MVLRILALLITVLLVNPVSSLGQTSSDFSYFFPRFTSAAGSELTIANLNNVIVDVEVEFFTESGGVTRKFITLLPATQRRLAPISHFGSQGGRSVWKGLWKGKGWRGRRI